MNMTLKTLTFLSGLIALSIAAPSNAYADMSTETSTLVISHDVYIPENENDIAAVTSETDMMPITDEAPERATVPHIILKAESAPQSLTPMPTKNLVIETEEHVIATQPQRDVVLSWRARSGENLQDVISRWGGRAEKTFTWKTQDTSQLHRSFSYFGTYHGAVEKLLKRETKPADYIENYTLNAGHRITGLKKND